MCLNELLGTQVVAGQTAALALKKVKRAAVRKGMVLVDERLKPQASWEFNAGPPATRHPVPAPSAVLTPWFLGARMAGLHHVACVPARLHRLQRRDCVCQLHAEIAILTHSTTIQPRYQVCLDSRLSAALS